MATGQVRSGLGTLLQRGNGASPEVFTTIPKVRNLKGPPLETTMLDTTALDTVGGYETMIPSLKKPGQPSFELDFMPDDSSHQALLGDFVNGTLRDFQIRWPDGVTIWSFQAYVSKWEPSAAPTAVLTAAITLQISGAPALVVD
jgi:predicted secreted protein